MIGKANAGRARRFDGAPAIVERTREMHERGIGIGETGREPAAKPQPGERAARGVALRRSGTARAETPESGTKRTEHCLIMGCATVRLQRRGGDAPVPSFK